MKLKQSLYKYQNCKMILEKNKFLKILEKMSNKKSIFVLDRKDLILVLLMTEDQKH